MVITSSASERFAKSGILLALRKLPKCKSFVYCKKYKNYNNWSHFWRDQQGLCLCQGVLFLGYLPLLFTAVAANLLFCKFMFEATPREPFRELTFKQTTLEALTSTRGNYEIRKHVKISWS